MYFKNQIVYSFYYVKNMKLRGKAVEDTPICFLLLLEIKKKQIKYNLGRRIIYLAHISTWPSRKARIGAYDRVLDAENETETMEGNYIPC